MKLLPWLESIYQDVKFGFRMLRKNAVATAAAVASLALAIGACTAAFSLIDALILRPLPVTEPERLVYVTYPPDEADSGSSHMRTVTYPSEEADSFSYPQFERLRAAAQPQADLFGMSDQHYERVVFDESDGQDEEIQPQYISGDAFQILGIKPALGRLLNSSDDAQPGGHPVAVISYELWKRHFGGSSAVLGHWLTLNEHQFQIIGVAQHGFTGVEPGLRTDLWVPNMMYKREALTEPGWRWFRIWGRLKPAVAPEQIRPIAQVVNANIRREIVARHYSVDEPQERIQRYINNPVYIRSAATGPSGLRRGFKRPLWILTLVAALVLLIACSNVANLLTARIAAREHEMALRVSIGAGRKRLLQQLIIESGLIAIAACVLGALFGALTAPVIVNMLSTPDSPVYLDLRPNARVFAFLAGAGTLTTLLFGLAPALRASGTSPVDALKKGALKASNRIGLLKPLLAAQVAFSFTVLFIAGLLLISFEKLSHVDPGFQKDGILLVSIGEKEFQKGDEKARVAWLQLQDHIRGLSGVQSVSFSDWELFSSAGWDAAIRVPGRKPEDYQPFYLGISPDFLKTMQIRLLDGREFDSRDSEPEFPSAAIVNEAFVRRYFPNEHALGRTFYRQGPNKTFLPQYIVGIARDAKYNDLRTATPPTVYSPKRGTNYGTLEIRTAMAPAAIASIVRKEIPSVHPGFKVTAVNLQSTVIDNTLIRERLLALLSGFFAVVAIVLAGVGLYGVLNYLVVQRTKEIGIRVALGAEQAEIMGLVLSNISLVMVLGLVCGLAIGISVAQLLAKLLFEVKSSDFESVALPLACLLFFSILAALPAAIRAVRIDPIVALRYE